MTQFNNKKKLFMTIGISSSIALAAVTPKVIDVFASVTNSGRDIRETDAHASDNSGVAMTYTRFDAGSSKQTASGSGVFIAPNVMVTVAHNYLDKNRETGAGFVRSGDSAQSHVVMNSNSEKRNGVPADGVDQLVEKGDIHYYNQNELGKSYTNDLAIVVLPKPVEAMTRGEDSHRTLGTAKRGDGIRLVGYPNDFSSKNLSSDARNTLKDGKLYEVRGTISELSSNGEGKYHMSALGGFSGGPVFNDAGQLVGIHQHGTNSDAIPEDQQYGAGLFFTDAHKAWLKEMVDKYAIKGWYVDGNDKYYYDDNHQLVKNEERTIDGARYHFDAQGRGTLISGKETGRVALRAVDKQGNLMFERVVGTGQVGSGFTYDFKSDKDNQVYFAENPNATVASIDTESIGKKFNETWDKDFASKYQLGNTVIKVVIDGGREFSRTVSGSVDNSGSRVKPLVADDKVKAVPNGEKNFNATVALTTEAGLGSGTLINEDTIVTVAHNFVHLNTKTNPISVVNNVNKSGDVHIATLPNGKQVRFSNDDVKFWNREGYVQGFKNDLAVIKLRSAFTGETPASMVNAVASLKAADTIHVFGFPKGKLNPILNGKVENVENYGANIMGVAYQGSAPGMSGGGLYNAQGELIGVHQNGVEGLRAGGISFSKEQLDWVKSIAKGENMQPVYLKDAVHNDDKDKKYENDNIVVKDGEVILGDKFDFNNYSRKNIDTDLSSVTKVTLVGEKAGNDKFIKDWVNEAKTKFTRTDLGDVTLLKDGSFVDIVNNAMNLNRYIYPDGVYTLGYSRTENEVVKHGYEYVSDSSLPFNAKVLQIEGRDGVRSVTYVYTVSPTGEVSTKPIRVADEDYVGMMLDGMYYVGNQKKETHEIDFNIRYESDDSKSLNEQEVVNPGSKGLRTIITTYSVNSKTGDLYDPVVTEEYKPMSERIIKVGTKSTVKEEVIAPKVIYQKDDTREKGQQNIQINGVAGKKVTPIKYDVNPDTGEVIQVPSESVTTLAKDTIIKVAAKDKVRYVINGEDVVKETTEYSVNPDTGEVTSKVTREISNAGGAKKLFDTKKTPSPKKYVKDDTREKDQPNIIEKGQDGEVIYEFSMIVDENTGAVTKGKPVLVKDTKQTDTIIKVASKDKVVTEEIESPKRYVGDEEQNYGSEPEETRGQKGSRTTTTVYTVNPENGNVTEDSTTTVKDPTETMIKVGTKPMVVKTKDDNGRTVITTTTYAVDSKTGKVTTTMTVSYENGKDPKVVTETIPSPRRYEKDPEREKGSEDIVIEGKDGKKVTTTTYKVNEQTGEITETVSEPIVTEPTETIVKIAAKDKVVTEEIQPSIVYERDDSHNFGTPNVESKGEAGKKVTTTEYSVNEKTGEVIEVVKEPVITPAGVTHIKVGTKTHIETIRNGGNAIERLTKYELDPKTGAVTEKMTERLVSSNGDTPAPILDILEYTKALTSNGIDERGNVVLPPTLTIPEYTGVLSSNGIDSEGNMILPPILNVSEYKGVLSSNGIDNSGNMIQPPVLDVPEFKGGVAPNDAPKVDIPEYKGEIKKPEEPQQITTIQEIKKPEKPQQTTTQKEEAKPKLPKTGVNSMLGLTATGLIATIGAAFAKLRKKK